MTMLVRYFNFSLIIIIFWSCQSNLQEKNQIIQSKTKSIVKIYEKNAIDSLQNETDVLNFMNRFKIFKSIKSFGNKDFKLGLKNTYYPSIYEYDMAQRCNPIYDTIQANLYFKADFDENGFNDLALHFKNFFFVILGQKNNTFTFDMSNNYHNAFNENCNYYTLTNIKIFDFSSIFPVLKRKSLILHHFYTFDTTTHIGPRKLNPQEIIDTITVFQDRLLLYNQNYKNLPITQIDFSAFSRAWDCLGSYPIFRAVITPNQILYQKTNFKTSELEERIFPLTMNEYQRICKIISYSITQKRKQRYSFLKNEENESLFKATIHYKPNKIVTILQETENENSLASFRAIYDEILFKIDSLMDFSLAGTGRGNFPAILEKD